MTTEEQQIQDQFEQFMEKPLAKNYNQSHMFQEIWRDRVHFSDLTNSPLHPQGHFKWHWQFLHVLPKGTFAKMKFFKPNIMLGTPDEHDNQDKYEVFREKREMLNRIYYRVVYGKEF